jgi:hypothetical protein
MGYQHPQHPQQPLYVHVDHQQPQMMVLDPVTNQLVPPAWTAQLAAVAQLTPPPHFFYDRNSQVRMCVCVCVCACV